VIDDLRPAPGASRLANDEIYLDIENVRLAFQNGCLDIENTCFENDASILPYLDPVIHETAVLNVEAPVADIEAEVSRKEARVLDIGAGVPDMEAAGFNVEVDVVIRVVALVI
jgi:hypothetical protein